MLIPVCSNGRYRSGDTIVFTQEVSGAGQISTVGGKTDATSSVSVGSGVTRTTNSGSDTVSLPDWY